MDIFRQSDMRHAGGRAEPRRQAGSGCHAGGAVAGAVAANMFTFAGDSSLSEDGKTKVRGTSPAPAARRPRAIARRQLST